jgi:glycosyltransferase 2 family protein
MSDKRKINWFLLFRMLGILLFIVLLFKIDLHLVWENIKKVKLIYFFWAILFQILMLFLKGIRWHILREEGSSPLNFLYNMGAFLESYAIGVITPGRLGEVMKAGYEKDRNDKWLSIFKIIAERGFDLGIFITVAGVSLAIYNILPLNKLAVLGIDLLGIICVIFSYLLLSSKEFIKIVRKFIFKMNKVQPVTLAESFQLKINQTNQILILSVLSNIVSFISCYFLAIGIALGSDFLFTSGGIAVTGLLNLLPISVMGLGTREISFLYIFRHYEQSVVMAFSFLVFLTMQIGGGMIALIFGQLLLFKYKKLKR